MNNHKFITINIIFNRFYFLICTQLKMHFYLISPYNYKQMPPMQQQIVKKANRKTNFLATSYMLYNNK